MQPPPETTDLLALRARPEIAAALRARQERIVQRWAAAVEKHLPDANPLTVKQVRDSVPLVLEKIALALETADSSGAAVLEEVGTAHGVARFQQHYDVEEVLIEYRLLRRAIFDELHAVAGGQLTFADAMPVDMGIDTALHRGVTSYVRHLIEQLNSAAAAESKYLSFLSHDLRNNLNTITLTLEALSMNLAASGDGQFAEAVEDIQYLRGRVFQTIGGMDRLLQAERLRKRAVELKLAPVDLHRLVDELLDHASREPVEGKELTFVNDVPAGAAAHSDRELVLLALQNLLGNAIKYSMRGAVRIAAEPDLLGWRIFVSDQGPGIAPERVAQLFDEFRRGETHGQAGMGLGLTIAAHAARLLGSELTVESKLGEGSTFSFTVPPAKSEEAA